MNKSTLIEHKKIIMVCEENEPISLSYNVILTTPKAKTVVKLVIIIIIIKSTLTCIYCGKTSHSMETYHNRKIEVLVVLTAMVEWIKPIRGNKTQLVKLRKIHVRYPYIVCFNVKHIFKKCPKKFELQNMFKTKLISDNVTITSKPPKIDNVPINVVVPITTHSQ
jgi:hypothetical protein